VLLPEPVTWLQNTAVTTVFYFKNKLLYCLAEERLDSRQRAYICSSQSPPAP
jgi:hypothetical protein